MTHETSSGKFKIQDYFFLLCLLIPLLPPEGLTTLSPILWLIVGKIGIFMSAFFLITLIIYKHKSIGKFLGVPFLFYFGISLLITLLLDEYPYEWVLISHASILMLFLINIYQNHIPQLIRTLLFYIEIISYINMIFMLMHPNGMYISESTGFMYNWLFGYKSSFQYYILPGIALSWINYYYCKQKIRFICFMTITLIMTILSRNAMLLVAIVILLLIMFFHLYDLTSIFNGVNYILATTIANIFFIFLLNKFANTSIVRSFLGLIGKNISLSNRNSIIWPIAKEYIKNRPWLGYGVLSSGKHINIYGGAAYIHAHNQVLEVLFSGGAILLLFYIAMLIYLIKVMMKNKHLASTKILSSCFFALMIMVIVEVFTRRIGAGIWLILYLMEITSQVDAQFTEFAKQKEKSNSYFPVQIKGVRRYVHKTK